MALIYVGSYGSGIRCYQQDLATGDLVQVHDQVEVTDPSFLAWHPSKEYLFAVCEKSDGKLAALRVAEQLRPRASVVTIMCDTGMKYLHKLGSALQH